MSHSKRLCRAKSRHARPFACNYHLRRAYLHARVRRALARAGRRAARRG